MACAPFITSFTYGSVEAHADRIRLNCGLYDLPNVTFPPSPFEACADALHDQPCNDWIDGVIPPACQGVGTLPAGTTCSAGFQCSTDLCDLGGNGCGKCIQPPAAGQPCYRGFCAAGLECNPVSVCVAPGAAGAACSDNQPCLSSLGCHAGTCGALYTAGQACASNNECDLYNGVICNMAMAKCVPVTTGPTCMLNTDGSYVFCAASGHCKAGTCTPTAAEGEACNATDGPTCMWPAFCSTTDMKCHVFQANRACPGAKAAVRPPATQLGLQPPETGFRAFWRSTLPPRTRTNF
jgi:hypothetical protein